MPCHDWFDNADMIMFVCACRYIWASEVLEFKIQALGHHGFQAAAQSSNGNGFQGSDKAHWSWEES
jgi:hypothetical protein